MILHLTDLSDEPLQQQIVRQIRAKILAGDLESGFSLQSIRALAKEQKVSVITVQRAYETLLRENLIHSRRGKGFYVSEIGAQQKKQMAVERLAENLQRPLLDAVSEGLEVEEIERVVEQIIKGDR